MGAGVFRFSFFNLFLARSLALPLSLPFRYHPCDRFESFRVLSFLRHNQHLSFSPLPFLFSFLVFPFGEK